MNPDDPVKYTMFTNLDWVTVNGVRTWTHALILEEGPHMFGGVKRSLRGLGVDPAWPVFDLNVPSIEYTLVDAQSQSVLLTDSEPSGQRPLCSGAIMQLKDGPELQLIVRDHKQPLDIKTFEGTWGDRVTTDRLWAHMQSRIPRYWNAPNMPALLWGPTPGFKGYGR